MINFSFTIFPYNSKSENCDSSIKSARIHFHNSMKRLTKKGEITHGTV